MNKKKDNSNLMMTLLKGRTLFVLIILFIFFSIKADSFCTVNSLLLVCKHVAQYGILGIGMTYVIITGGIDLSVGSVVGSLPDWHSPQHGLHQKVPDSFSCQQYDPT